MLTMVCGARARCKDYKWFQTEAEAADFFNTPDNIQIRSDLYAGRRNSSCIDCYTAEDSGGMSYRKALKKTLLESKCIPNSIRSTQSY